MKKHHVAWHPPPNGGSYEGTTLVVASVGAIEHAYPLANRCWIAEHPTREMGRWAARRLLDRIDQPQQTLPAVSLHMRWTTNMLLEQHLKASTVGQRLWR